jgi:hypothetical protein
VSAWETHNDDGIYLINDRVQFVSKRNDLTYTSADDEYHSAISRDVCYVNLDGQELQGTQFLREGEEDIVNTPTFRSLDLLAYWPP